MPNDLIQRIRGLTQERLAHAYFKFWTQFGSAVGLMTGLLLGLAVLFFGAGLLLYAIPSAAIWLGSQIGLSLPASLLLMPVVGLVFAVVVGVPLGLIGRLFHKKPVDRP